MPRRVIVGLALAGGLLLGAFGVVDSAGAQTGGDGKLAVTKIVSPDPLGIGNSTLYPMTVTCTSPTSSYSLNVPGNTSSVPTTLPVGSICSVAETMFPLLAYGCTWLAPVYSPATVTIASGMNILTVTNGYQCNGKPDEITGCLKDSKVQVTCNPNGTYTVTLSGGSFTGTNITLTSQTPGVTVTPPQQPWAATMTWTVTGATAGQTVALVWNGIKVGGGSVPGTDLCCSGEIKITMPDCPDVKVDKENTPAGGSGTWFNVWVTNVGAPITFPAGGITITENIPANMTVTGVTGTGWSCVPPTMVGPGQMLCTYNLAGTLPTNASLSSTMVVNYTTTGPGPFTNCAVVGIGSSVGVDGNPANDKACVTVTATPVDVGIVKTGGTSPPTTVPWYSWHLTVTNVGAPFNGTNVITVTDIVPPGMQFNTATGGPNWDCITLSPPFPIPAGGTLTCTYTGTGPATPGQVLGTINITAWATGPGPFPPITNCATVSLASGSGYQDNNPANDKDCATVAKPGECPPPMVQLPGGQCICPTGTVQSGTQCVPVPPSSCRPPLVLNAAGQCVDVRPPLVCAPPMVPGPVPGVCVCPAGTTLVGRECVRQTVCPPPLVPGPVAGQCVEVRPTCERPKEMRRGQCVDVRPTCERPKVMRGGQCVEVRPTCERPKVMRGGKCVDVPRPACIPPAKLNRRNVCECPRDMEAIGKRCIKRDRRPAITPGDIIRTIPGRGRETPRDPRGGGQGPAGSPGRR